MSESSAAVPRGFFLALAATICSGSLLTLALVRGDIAPWKVLGVAVAFGCLAALGVGRVIDRRLRRPLVAARQRAEDAFARCLEQQEVLYRSHASASRRQQAEDERRLETQRELVANVSHELKTPLTSIRGYAETLADGALEDPETARRFTGRILDQCERLEALLRDLLTLSRLDARPPSRGPLGLDLVPMAHHAVETLAPLARRLEIRLDLEIGQPPPPPVAAEADDIERLLLNLIENAIKYNRPRGSVRLVLSAVPEGARVEVRDTGLGIPQGDLKRIFERFYRVDKGRTRSQGGTGLGLSIVAQLVRGLGGEVTVESRLGHGSAFRVDLPAILPGQEPGLPSGVATTPGTES